MHCYLLVTARATSRVRSVKDLGRQEAGHTSLYKQCSSLPGPYTFSEHLWLAGPFEHNLSALDNERTVYIECVGGWVISVAL